MTDKTLIILSAQLNVIQVFMTQKIWIKNESNLIKE